MAGSDRDRRDPRPAPCRGRTRRHDLGDLEPAGAADVDAQLRGAVTARPQGGDAEERLRVGEAYFPDRLDVRPNQLSGFEPAEERIELRCGDVETRAGRIVVGVADVMEDEVEPAAVNGLGVENRRLQRAGRVTGGGAVAGAYRPAVRGWNRFRGGPAEAAGRSPREV